MDKIVIFETPTRILQAPDENHRHGISAIIRDDAFSQLRECVRLAMGSIPGSRSFSAHRVKIYPENFELYNKQTTKSRPCRGAVVVIDEQLPNGGRVRAKEIHLSEEGFSTLLVVWEEVCHCIYRGPHLDSPGDDPIGLLEIYMTFSSSVLYSPKNVSATDRKRLINAITRLVKGLDPADDIVALLERNGRRGELLTDWQEMLATFKKCGLFSALHAETQNTITDVIAVLAGI